MSAAFFIAGTDTDVGKTTIASGLLHAARLQGLSTLGAKPVASGCDVTPKGLRNSEICESSLPMSVRLLTDRNVAAYNQMLLRKEQVRAQVTPRENGTYTVTLHFSDDVDELLHLELMAATRDLAQGLADRFQKNPEQFYTRLMDTLFPKE